MWQTFIDVDWLTNWTLWNIKMPVCITCKRLCPSVKPRQCDDMLCSSCEEKRLAGLASELLQRRTRSMKSGPVVSTPTDATESTLSEPDVQRAPPGYREDDAEPEHPSSPASPKAATAAEGVIKTPKLSPAHPLNMKPWSLHQWWHSLRERHSVVGVPQLPHVTRLCGLTHQYDYQPIAGYV